MSENNNGLPEAGFSATVKIVNSATKFEWLVTTRSDSTADGLKRLAIIEKWATDNGYLSFDEYVDQRRAERGDSRPAPAYQANEGDAPYFTVQKIKAAQASDKNPDLMWKIQGDKSKYPVPIYEAIEAAKPALAQDGIDLNGFVTSTGKLKEFDLTGWVAYYEQNEKGYPKKVIRLEKV